MTSGMAWQVGVETLVDTHLVLYFLVRIGKRDYLLKNIAISVKVNSLSPVVKGPGNKDFIPIIRPVIPKRVQSVTEWSSIFLPFKWVMKNSFWSIKVQWSIQIRRTMDGDSSVAVALDGSRLTIGTWSCPFWRRVERVGNLLRDRESTTGDTRSKSQKWEG